MRHRLTAVMAFGALFACAHLPVPGEPGYPYNLDGTYRIRFSVEGESYSGTADLSTAMGGAVTGEFRLTGPMRVDGGMEGTISGDTLTWTGDYTMPSQGCTGTTRGSGPIAEGGASVSGRVRIDDSCFGRLSGRFSFNRQ